MAEEEKSVLDDERYREAIRIKSNFSGFERNAAWQHIVAMLKDVEEHCIQELTASEINPSMDSTMLLLSNERMKVKLQTVRLLMNFPANVLADAEDLVQLYRSANDGEEAEEES